MEFEEIDRNPDKFLQERVLNIETELKKIGIRLINVNILDNSESKN